MNEIRDVTNDFDHIEELAIWLIRHYVDSQEPQEVVYNDINVRAGEGDTEEIICCDYNFHLILKEKEPKPETVTEVSADDLYRGTWM